MGKETVLRTGLANVIAINPGDEDVEFSVYFTVGEPKGSDPRPFVLRADFLPPPDDVEDDMAVWSFPEGEKIRCYCESGICRGQTFLLPAEKVSRMMQDVDPKQKFDPDDRPELPCPLKFKPGVGYDTNGNLMIIDSMNTYGSSFENPYALPRNMFYVDPSMPDSDPKDWFKPEFKGIADQCVRNTGRPVVKRDGTTLDVYELVDPERFFGTNTAEDYYTFISSKQEEPDTVRTTRRLNIFDRDKVGTYVEVTTGGDSHYGQLTAMDDLGMTVTVWDTGSTAYHATYSTNGSYFVPNATRVVLPGDEIVISYAGASLESYSVRTLTRSQEELRTKVIGGLKENPVAAAQDLLANQVDDRNAHGMLPSCNDYRSKNPVIRKRFEKHYNNLLRGIEDYIKENSVKTRAAKPLPDCMNSMGMAGGAEDDRKDDTGFGYPGT